MTYLVTTKDGLEVMRDSNLKKIEGLMDRFWRVRGYLIFKLHGRKKIPIK